MMKRFLVLLLILLIFTPRAYAAELSREYIDALPDDVRAASETDSGVLSMFTSALDSLGEKVRANIGEYLRGGMRAVILFLLVVLLCGVVDGMHTGVDDAAPNYTPMVGTLAILTIASGDVRSLLGLGTSVIGELSRFSTLLIPTLGAAIAASGHAASAGVWQVGTVFFADILLGAVERLLHPMVYVYIGLCAANTVIENGRLAPLAEAVRSVATWSLKAVLVVFTTYLALTNVISGSTDQLALKAAKAAISGAVPVVGGTISDAAETVLTGARVLKDTVGILGMTAVLSICILPFLQMGVQYILYKAASALARAVGAKSLGGLIDALGCALGLMLAMTAACALMLLISMVVSITVVVT
ncbi:MAG: stage III sporulation protein AE [Oscillospiraceae bacterium]|nr:stage III sporulation protein AE [Oscillospiraceae bacterium]